MSQAVTYESEGKIAVITLNRPEKMNALNDDLIVCLQNTLKLFQESDDRVAILHAAGDKAFSVGADIKEPPKEMWQGVPSIGADVTKPIIAAVHGWCIGGAYVIIQMCDLVIASSNTIFKYPEAQLGLSGGLIASAVARIPHKVAMEFMLLGEDFLADRACEAGMVNKVVGERQELKEARIWAEILAKSAPLVVETLKNFSLATLNQSPAETGAIARHELLAISTSTDGAEGRSAFRDKRDPKFNGD